VREINEWATPTTDLPHHPPVICPSSSSRARPASGNVSGPQSRGLGISGQNATFLVKNSLFKKVDREISVMKVSLVAHRRDREDFLSTQTGEKSPQKRIAIEFA
jgi:hypothetical protein